MDFGGKIRNFLEKLQGLPEKKKKIILWSVVSFSAIVMGYFWVNSVILAIPKIAQATSSIKMPAIDLPAFPKTPALDILQTSQTADWQTYISNVYGFEFKIPADWIAQEYPGGVRFTTDKLLKQKDVGDFPNFVADLRYIEKDGDKFEASDLVNGSSQVEFNNIMWTRYQPEGMVAYVNFRTLYLGKGYDFGVLSSSDNDLIMLEGTLRQVLSTFKFTK